MRRPSSDSADPSQGAGRRQAQARGQQGMTSWAAEIQPRPARQVRALPSADAAATCPQTHVPRREVAAERWEARARVRGLARCAGTTHAHSLCRFKLGSQRTHAQVTHLTRE